MKMTILSSKERFKKPIGNIHFGKIILALVLIFGLIISATEETRAVDGHSVLRKSTTITQGATGIVIPSFYIKRENSTTYRIYGPNPVNVIDRWPWSFSLLVQDITKYTFYITADIDVYTLTSSIDLENMAIGDICHLFGLGQQYVGTVTYTVWGKLKNSMPTLTIASPSGNSYFSKVNQA